MIRNQNLVFAFAGIAALALIFGTNLLDRPTGVVDTTEVADNTKVDPNPQHMDQHTLELLARANAGDADAQFELGAYYAGNLEDAPENGALAAQWLETAARNGHVAAQNEMGYAYERGQYGLAANYGSARRWYKLAAEQGDSYALYNLGVLYRDGRGISRSESVATDYFRRSAQQGYPTALFELGIRMKEGLGIDRSQEDGIATQRAAVSQGFDAAEYLRSELDSDGDFLVKLSVVNYLEAQTRDIEALPKNIYTLADKIRAMPESDEPAELKVMEKLQALAALPQSASDDFAPPAAWRDPKLIASLFRISAVLGHDEAQAELARLYLTDFFGSPNGQEASYWHDRAARQKH